MRGVGGCTREQPRQLTPRHRAFTFEQSDNPASTHAASHVAGSLQPGTATATHAAAARAAAAQAQAAASGVQAVVTPADACHTEQGAEYGGEDVIEWGTNNLKVCGGEVERDE